MKYILSVLFVFCICQCNAQYFESNQVFASTSGGVHESIGYTYFDVAPDGKQIIRISYHPCLPCDHEVTECIVEPDGSVSCYNMFLNYYRHSYFDKEGDLLVVNETDSGYTLTSTAFSVLLAGTSILHVDADTSGNVYVFEYYSTDSSYLSVYDSSGMLTDYRLINGTLFNVTSPGTLFTSVYQRDTLYHYSHDTAWTLLNTFPGSFPLGIASEGNRFWIRTPQNTIQCIDTGGTVLYTVSITPYIPLSFEHSGNDTLYIWSHEYIYKFHGDSMLWRVKTDGAGTETMKTDANGNLYYISSYQEPFWDDDGIFQATSYGIPPSIAFAGYQEEPQDLMNIFAYVITGKISPEYVDTFSVHLNYIDIQSPICTGYDFKAYLNFSCMPFQHAMDTFLIELSDSAGTFVNPAVIGEGTGLIINCSIDNSFPAGSGILVRTRSKDSTVISPPYHVSFEVLTSPSATIYMENSIFGNQACAPMKIVAQPDSALEYEWFGFFDPGYYFFPDTTPYIEITDPYNGIGVTVTDPVNGCRYTPEMIYYVNSIDTAFFTGFSIALPDTVYRNDAPFLLHAGVNDTITGPGIYPELNHYLFIPDSIGNGMHEIKLTIEHIGTPCVPYEYFKNVYVDTLSYNIITEALPGNEICQNEPFEIHFSLIDSTIYDSTNVFYVEKGYYDSDFHFIATEVVGSGTASPVQCQVANTDISFMRFRVVSGQTGEKGSLNKNGNITLYSRPFVQYTPPFASLHCFRDTISFDFYADSASLFYNDTLVTTQYQAPFLYAPGHEGLYSLILYGYCTSEYDSIEVNHSSNIPYLTLLTWNQLLCGDEPVELAFAVDSGAYLQWFHNELLLPGENNDTLFVTQPGGYLITATDSTGCIITAQNGYYMFSNPRITLQSDSMLLCPGEMIELSTFDNGNYLYQWIKNDSILLATNYNQIVDDTGRYVVVVTGEMNCIDTSEAVIITRHTLATPIIHQGAIVNIQYGSTVTLSTDSVQDYSYQWLRNNNPLPGAGQWYYIADKPGHYSVEVSIPQGCFAQSETIRVKQRIRYQGPVHSTERGQEGNDEFFTIYPNPSSGLIAIEGVASAQQKINISVHDLYGRMVFASELTAEEGSFSTSLDLHSVNSGLYTVSLSMADGLRCIPVVITR